MSRISVIGICGVSMFMKVDHFHEKGETLIADAIYKEIGGKGVNQAIAARRMVADVSFLAALGDDDDANECESVIKGEGIDAHCIRKKGKNTAIAYILTDKNGENQVTEFKSAELNPEDVVQFEDAISSSDILLLQQEVPEEVNEAAVKIAKKHGVKVILNPAPARDIPDRIASDIYMVTPNEQEAKAIDPVRFENCITTLGAKGCDINGEIQIPATSVTPVDTTGAGDTFNGVLAACLSEGLTLEKACRCAVYAASISVSGKYVLNSIPYRKELIEGGLL